MAKGKGKHKHLGKGLKTRAPAEGNLGGTMHGTPMAHKKGKSKGRTA